MSPDADPNNPEGEFRFVAGELTVSPEGEFVYAGVFDWAEKARSDFLDRARKHDPDPLNGMQVPVRRVRRSERARNRAAGGSIRRRIITDE